MENLKNPVIHFEIGCSNLDKTKQFYLNCFQWKITPNGISEDIFTGESDGISGHITSAVTELPNHVLFYIEVQDVSKALGKIESEGGTTVVPPILLPNGNTFAWFRDIAGNVLGILTKSSS